MERPNLVVITCHDLGRYLGCYGAPVDSPYLDKLAADGVCFQNAFATSPLCSPSRAAIHTGLYPHRVGVNGLSHPPFSMEIEEPEKHLAHLLADAGYEKRILIGFQHLTMAPETLGYTDTRFKLDSAESISAEASDLIEGLEMDEPFYLEVGFFETHRPFDWGGVEAKPASDGNPFPNLPDSKAAREEAGALAAAVEALDKGVGRILQSLESKGIADNTWVIFVTDHGLPFPRAKGTLYDPGLETTLIMRWPKAGLKDGIEVNGLVSLVDLVPTIVSALECGAAEQLDGIDLWPWLQLGCRDSCPREVVFGEKTFHSGYEPMRSVRSDRYKLIVNFETGPAFDIPTDIIATPTALTVLEELPNLRPVMELYDLEKDPSEKTNLADEPGLKSIRDKLRFSMEQWMLDTGDPLLAGPPKSPRLKLSMDQ
ncbi:MAG: sulfatase [Puniceicoccaceae bacterium]